MSWSEFEVSCKEYLNNNYDCKDFKCVGGSDSTVSDISYKRGKFYIECKMPIAQCGQFVVKNLSGKFVYSEQNKNELNLESRAMIKIMNNDEDAFAEAGTSGKTLKVDEDTIFRWIEKAMEKKKVEFIITKNNGKFFLFNKEHLKHFFNVEATYRQKTSGSNKISTIHEPNFLKEFNKHIGQNDSGATIEDKRLITNSNSNYHELIISANGRRFLLKQDPQRRKGVYKIRQLSNTHNSNVIFSISFKTINDGMNQYLLEADKKLRKLIASK
ncbi:hypothetical protein [Taylorella equigenitalis]|uniref:Uncharacterized protein n=1 Tax=Taylorella equigenitalis (strain MCE9) TaxID=937774 RepID=A0A654KJ90_TAYEM|nr:hypothetical protein [Taylorella equigenitalis]ADU92475.1 hypothetical protein TEQUI_1563 [Taylorella equigenitalis MCE9]ASY30657.1 hypothetical protein B9Z30_04640 [Taylorella equigenitalis]ASY40951.1 hypothetical protein CAV20_04575 [Taylorella equigenitalis]KOS58269.1 hypothetical protein AM589_07430 [Taylorella equigenitalis]WDU55765.1 hypothetical protein KPH58_04610 [Taylorella equigenitalis]